CAEDAHPTQFGDDLVREAALLVVLADHRRDAVAGETRHRVAQAFLFLGEPEIHGVSLPYGPVVAGRVDAPRAALYGLYRSHAVAAAGERTVLAAAGRVTGD